MLDTSTVLQIRQVVDGHTRVSPYGYTPSAAANIAFLAIFSVLTILHAGMGIKFRTWYFSLVFCLGGIGEILGYVGRVGSAFDVTKDIYFILQICCLIFAPAFFSCGLYLTLSNLAVIVGPKNARWKPIWYIIVFSTFDIIALTIQGLGGGKAAKAQINGTSTTTATHLMEIGIIIQAVGNIIFTIVAFLLFLRTHLNCRKLKTPTPFPQTFKFKIFVAAIIISDVMILVRAVYRVMELHEGWKGELITTEWYFYVFDTMPMIVCMGVWILGQPGWMLGVELANAHFRLKGKDSEKETTPPMEEIELNGNETQLHIGL